MFRMQTCRLVTFTGFSELMQESQHSTAGHWSIISI